MKLLLLLLLPLAGFSQSPADSVYLVAGKVEISVTRQLSRMSAEMWALKYQRKARPELVLTDEKGEVNLIGDLTPQPANESQLESFKDYQLGALKKSRPDLKVLAQGLKTVNGIKLGYFKFISQAIDQKVFNYFFFCIVKGKIMFFSFNCIEKLQADWEKAADDIVASLKVRQP